MTHRTRPFYRSNPAQTIDRLGRKLTDDMTGFVCYENFLTYQNGFARDYRNRGSFDNNDGLDPGILGAANPFNVAPPPR